MYRPPTVRMRPLGRDARKRRMRPPWAPWADTETAARVRAERAHARRLGRERRAAARAMRRAERRVAA